jgi:hypothetical protein
MKYKDILEYVLAGKQVRVNCGKWFTMKEGGNLYYEGDDSPFTLMKDLYDNATWEVKAGNSVIMSEYEFKLTEWHCHECFRNCQMFFSGSPKEIFSGCEYNDRMVWWTACESETEKELKRNCVKEEVKQEVEEPYILLKDNFKTEPPTTLIQAIEQKKIVPCDKIRFTGTGHLILSEKFNLTDINGVVFEMTAKDWMSKNFEIIKQQPKIKTAEDCHKIDYGFQYNDSHFNIYNSGFKSGEEVGKVKEQLRINPAILLIDEIDTSLACDNLDRVKIRSKLVKILTILQSEEEG